jgi:hypothetical protein
MRCSTVTARQLRDQIMAKSTIPNRPQKGTRHANVVPFPVAAQTPAAINRHRGRLPVNPADEIIEFMGHLSQASRTACQIVLTTDRRTADQNAVLRLRLQHLADTIHTCIEDMSFEAETRAMGRDSIRNLSQTGIEPTPSGKN